MQVMSEIKLRKFDELLDAAGGDYRLLDRAWDSAARAAGGGPPKRADVLREIAALAKSNAA